MASRDVVLTDVDGNQIMPITRSNNVFTGEGVTLDETLRNIAGGGSAVVVDSALSEISENPVQNKAIASKLNEVFQSVSNGKELIASAITDKGIETDATAEFSTMAENISNIEGGTSLDIEGGHVAYFYDNDSKLMEVHGVIDGTEIVKPHYFCDTWRDKEGNVYAFPLTLTEDVKLYAMTAENYAQKYYAFYNISETEYPYLYIGVSVDKFLMFFCTDPTGTTDTQIVIDSGYAYVGYSSTIPEIDFTNLSELYDWITTTFPTLTLNGPYSDTYTSRQSNQLYIYGNEGLDYDNYVDLT